MAELTVPNAALIDVVPPVPLLAAVTSPMEPGALLIEATPTAEDVQVAAAVRFCVELSETRSRAFRASQQ